MATPEDGHSVLQTAYAKLRLCQAQCEVLVERVEELLGGLPLLVRSDEQGEVLGHVTGLNTLDDNVFQRVRKLGQRRVVVELGAVSEPTGPRVDRGDRVGRRRLACLVLAV